MKTPAVTATAAVLCAAVALAAAGCATHGAPESARARRRSPVPSVRQNERGARDGDHAHETFEDLQVRVMPDGSFEYLGDVYRDTAELTRRVRRDAVSGKGRNRQIRPVVLAARGKVPLSRMQALRKRFNDEGLPSVAIRAARVSSVTVSPPPGWAPPPPAAPAPSPSPALP